ncbi:MAG: hypothetical protein WBW84_03855 [Acidobacteriaceae bacterium]
MIDTEVFCEGHKELIIEAAGVDRFRILRLTDGDCAFQSGGRISMSVAAKKEAQNPNGKIVRTSH